MAAVVWIVMLNENYEGGDILGSSVFRNEKDALEYAEIYMSAQSNGASRKQWEKKNNKSDNHYHEFTRGCEYLTVTQWNVK